MKTYNENETLYNFKAWSGAVDTQKALNTHNRCLY